MSFACSVVRGLSAAEETHPGVAIQRHASNSKGTCHAVQRLLAVSLREGPPVGAALSTATSAAQGRPVRSGQCC
jgi:hypothetical protein